MRRLAYDTRVEAAVTGTAALWLLAADLLQPSLVPEKCRWCYRRANGASSLNVVDRSVRDALKWDHTETADSISSGIAFAFMPTAAVGLPAVAAAYDKHLHYAPIDSLLVAEATFIAADVNQLVKFMFARERPYVHYLPHLPDGIQGPHRQPVGREPLLLLGPHERRVRARGVEQRGRVHARLPPRADGRGRAVQRARHRWATCASPPTSITCRT